MSNDLTLVNSLPPGMLDQLENDLKEQHARLQTGSNRPPFKQIKMPQSGGSKFKVETAKNMFAELDSLTMHIIHIQDFRQQWQNKNLVCQSDNSERARASRVLYPNQVCDLCPDEKFQPRPDGKSNKPK